METEPGTVGAVVSGVGDGQLGGDCAMPGNTSHGAASGINDQSEVSVQVT